MHQGMPGVHTTTRAPPQDQWAWKPPALWVGLSILLLAALLRLAGFEETPIGGDQSGILSTAAEIASFRAFPLTGGRSSAGVTFTAIPQYLAAIPLFLVAKSSAVKWFFSLLDLLAIAWLYHAVRKAIGFRAAWISALLYATNPWIVEFVRWIWQPTVVPAFASAAFASFLLLLAPAARKRQGLLALALVSTTLMGLVHPSALPWAALLFLLTLLLAWRKGLWRGFWAGLGGSLLLASPYLIHLVRTRFADLSLLLQAGTGNGGAWNLSAFRLGGELLTGKEVLSTPRSPLWADAVLQIPFTYTLLPPILALALLGAGLRILRQREERPLLLFVTGWSLLVPASFLRSNVHLQHFYVLFLFPAPFVLVGAWIQGCFAHSSRRIRETIQKSLGRLAMALLLLLALWWAHLWGVRIHLEQQGRLGGPARAWLVDRTADQVRHYLEDHPLCQVILLTYFDGDLSPFDCVRALVQSDRVRIVPAGQGMIVPPDCTCYMLGPQTSEADLAPVASRVIEQPDMHIPARSPWRFYCAPAREEAPPPLAKWENGLSLLQADLGGDLEPGGQLSITYTWHYQEVTRYAYHFFTHLLLGETLVAQRDGPGIPTWYWRDDDLLVTHFDLSLPTSLAPGEYRLRVGAYGWPDLQRVPLVDGRDGYEVQHWIVP
jgi:hypothetical protein